MTDDTEREPGKQRPETTSPLDLPIFGDAIDSPGKDRGRGRVRSAFMLDLPPATLDGDPPDSSAAETEAPSPDPFGSLIESRPSKARHGHTHGEVDWGVVRGLRVEVASRLADRMGDARWDRAEQEAEGWVIIRALLDSQAAEAVATGGQVRSVGEQETVAQAVFDACFGMGRLQPLLDDDRIENIMITGCDRVMVEHADGTLWRMPPVADSDEELIEFIAYLAARSDNPRSFTPSKPSLHLTLPDGSRLAAAQDTARVSVVIRRHRVREVTLDDLVAWGNMTPLVANFLHAAVQARLSIVISGDQGAGKTTNLRALCSAIAPSEVLGTFETEYELFLHEMPEKHWIVHAWEAREGSGERGADGRIAGSRATSEQLRDSFRYRLDRGILGEVLGPEAFYMLKLMESGAGSLSTTHSKGASDTIRKLITCAMESGPHMTYEVVADKLAATVDLVVHLGCVVVPGPEGSAGQKLRYIDEVVHVRRGEKSLGYSADPVFARVPRRCAVPYARPDELMAVLVEHGFDAALFDAGVVANGAMVTP